MLSGDIPKPVLPAADLEGIVEDRTEALRLAHERAIEQADRDTLTGVASRARFLRTANIAVAAAKRSGFSVAFVVIDIDNFKTINDTFGHDAGDAVLKHAADQFSKNFRGTDLVARTGGDEFCAILPAGKDGKLDAVLDRLMNCLKAPVVHGNRPIHISASIGYAIFPDHGDDFRQVICHADAALYRSKSSGRGIFTAFNQEMIEAISRRQKLEKDLQTALYENEFEPWFQPIVDAPNGNAIVGVEALARWRREDGSIIAPGQFIQVLDECGWTQKLFESILLQSMHATRDQIQTGSLGYLTVNVSPNQFRNGSVVGAVREATKRTKFPASCLVLEITEEVLLADGSHEQIEALNSLGVRIALDDFGNGYANIGYLRRLPFQKLKLDRSLTADAANDKRSFAVIKAVADLSKALGLRLIAEGIDTAEQADAIVAAGCEHLQGYLFGRPMPFPELASTLKSKESALA